LIDIESTLTILAEGWSVVDVISVGCISKASYTD